MTQDIIIGGVSINELKRQRDAMQKDANKFVAESITSAQALVKQILEADADTDPSLIDGWATEANELLKNAALVSGVTGVTYYLDYYEGYGGCDDVLSQELENSENENVDPYGNGPVGALFDTLSDMEGTSRDWHSSTC